MRHRIFIYFLYFLPLKRPRSFAGNSVPLKSITIKSIVSMMKRSIKIFDDKWRLHIKMGSLKLFLHAIKYPFYDIISFTFHLARPNYFVFNICKCLSDDYPFTLAVPLVQGIRFFSLSPSPQSRVSFYFYQAQSSIT